MPSTYTCQAFNLQAQQLLIRIVWKKSLRTFSVAVEVRLDGLTCDCKMYDAHRRRTGGDYRTSLIENDYVVGVVLEHLINVLKRIYDSNAPELQSEQEFKDFLESKPDVFRIAISCNNVERARLTSPRRASKGLIGLTISTLQDLVRFMLPRMSAIRADESLSNRMVKCQVSLHL